jgi:hypothetical protein
VILVAAVVPPLSLVTLVQFAKGGYLLAYLPGAVIALLLAPAALLRDRPDRRRPVPKRSPVAAGAWFAVASLAVVAIAGLGVQRFLSGTGVLPVTPAATGHGLWLTQARYQAPYGATRSAIRTADSLDAALARLGPFVDPRRDVVVIDTVDGGSMFYRNAGWELPGQRVALIIPGQAIYNEQLGSLYYTSTTTVPVAPGGYVYLIAPPNLPGLARVTADLQAVPVKRAPTIADYRVWKVSPGASVLGVRVVARPGARPLGSGLSG